MGDRTFSRALYKSATLGFSDKEPVTRKAEQEVRQTGKLNPLVDPMGFGVIRRSLPRLEQQKSGLWRLTVGTPMPIETRVDTTGSMGGNVDVAFRVLPRMYELCSEVLPGYDLQIATGIFGDVQDRFVLCRPQFEMTAEKIVEQLTLMVPERDGGDATEDPHYGLFGAAYLTAAHINRVGLMGYDFTVSDAPARDRLDERQLKRIFGDDVFAKVAENGHKLDINDLPSTKEVVQSLLKGNKLFTVRDGRKSQKSIQRTVCGRAHAFFLQVGGARETTKFWINVFGQDRVVVLPSTELLPQVQATIIGLTEGALALDQVNGFLEKNNVSAHDAEAILRSVANIPIGAQAALPNFSKRPQKGDLFREKTDVWPVDQNADQTDASSADSESEVAGGVDWL